MYKNIGNGGRKMLKKTCIAILFFGMALSIAGCGKQESTGDRENTALTEQPEIKRELYWEETEDLGLDKKSTVCLESSGEHSDLKLVIDGEVVSLAEEKGIQYENPNYTKMKTKDLDKDGIMEIILLFYGGAGGTYQNFRMVKWNGEKWGLVPMDFSDEEMETFVEVTGSGNNSVQINVQKTGYKKTVQLPPKYASKKEVVSGIGYHFFEIRKEDIIVAYRVYADHVGDGIGDVRQKIRFDETGKKLILGETDYMPIEKAKERKYEVD